MARRAEVREGLAGMEFIYHGEAWVQSSADKVGISESRENKSNVCTWAFFV